MTKFPREFATNPSVHRFLDFVVERQNLWRKKVVQKEDPPWTTDPILENHFFTNIYRELDRVSQFELKEIEKYEGSPEEQARRILILRHTNSPDTYKILTEGGTLSDLEDLQNSQDRKAKRYLVSDAMIWIPAPSYSRTQWIWHWWKELLPAVLPDYLDRCLNGTPEEIIGQVTRIPRMGRFYAYEVMTSLTYCRFCQWTEDDFLVVGPGCPPSIMRWTYSKDWPSDKALENYVKDLTPRFLELLEKRGDFFWIPKEFQPRSHTYNHKWTLRVVEHSSCEWRKYCNLEDGKGRRRKYHH